MRINIVNKPLNHRRWKVIYLLAILSSLMFAPYGKADITQPVEKPRVEYHRKVLDTVRQILQWRGILYSQTSRQTQQKKKLTLPQIPDAEPTPYPPQVERRGKRAREHALAQSAKARSLSLPVRGQNSRRSHRASIKSPQGKGAVYAEARGLSLGGSP
jgi:hypothetical protein